MPENYVEVELIKNPSVKRTMNVNSFKMNQKKWRLQTGESLTAPVKKKVVEPAASKPEIKVTKIESEGGIVAKALVPESEFATISEETGDGLIESLRAQYEGKTGKKPDGRWNVSRLTKEINA